MGFHLNSDSVSAVPAIDVIGHKAHAAILVAGGRARVISRTTTALWLQAGDAIVWLGGGGMLHPRAMIATTPSAVDGDVVDLDVATARVWRPPALDLDRERAAMLTRGATGLRVTLSALGEPDGLARLLVADAPPPTGILAAVLARAAPRIEALAAACRADRAVDAVEPAVALLGLGPGLTPAGDDFVGGLLFARRLLATADVADAAAWRDTADAVVRAARERTHPISAALLGDLAAGESHAALHDLVAQLATGADPLDAARRLARIGHSSGWDILAGALCGFATR